MHQLVLYLLGLIAFKTLRKSIVIIMATSLVAMIIAFYTFFMSMIVKVYNLIDLVSSIDTSNPTLSYFFDFANATGIMDGFSNGMPFIYSALVFVLTKILFQHTLEILKTVFFISKTVLEG